jgi:hypothetical protein
LVLAGLPTTSTLTLRLATLFSALPWAVKILAFSSSRSLRSMPGAARTGADQQRVVGVLERDFRVVGADHAGQQRERAVFQFHHHALERGLGLLHRQLQHLQDHRLVLAQHFAEAMRKQQQR